MSYFNDGEPCYFSVYGFDANLGDVINKANPIVVNVPAECFAAEPATWEKTWVNHFYRQKVVDQCDFRRRLFAYLLQPFVLLSLFVVKLPALMIATAIGSKNWSLKYFRPLMYGAGDAYDMINGGSIFIRNVNVGDNPVWFLIRTGIFIPLFFIPTMVLLYFHCFAILLFAYGVPFGVLLFMACLLSSHIVSDLVTINFLNLVNKMKMLFHKKSASTLWYLEKSEMDLITCEGRTKTVKIADLPAKNRTISLRFHDLKSKVCRPFSA